MTEETLYTISELAARAKVSDDTIRRRMSEIPDLVYYQPRRKILIPESEAERILNRVDRLSVEK
jgi:DeoR/GlpR family transcriptional regulator of sugar metabolism